MPKRVADVIHIVDTEGDLTLANYKVEGSLFFSRDTGKFYQLINDVFVLVGPPGIHTTTAGITASTTQTQGQGALTNTINEVSVVANANDTVTLPAAAIGKMCVVINNGANTLKIFPASGDNLGAGVDTSTTLATTAIVSYQAYDATNWEMVSPTDPLYTNQIIAKSGPLKIGSASSGHALTATNDLLIGGKLEVDGTAFFDGIISAATALDIAHTINRNYADGPGAAAVLSIVSDHTNAGSPCLLLDQDGRNLAAVGVKMLFHSTAAQQNVPTRPFNIIGGSGFELDFTFDMDLHTLAAANTSDIADFLPAGAMITNTSFRVTTAVTTSAASNTWQAGTVGDTDAFVAAGKSGALNTTATNADWTITGPLNIAALAALRFSAPGAETFTAGVIRAVINYSTLTAPTS